MSIEPMLAGKVEDVKKLKFPLLGSPKLDGIRALVINGGLYSRKIKLIPNELVQKKFKKLPEGTDGELILGDPTTVGCFLQTQSAVMTKKKIVRVDNLKFHVFDNFLSKEKGFSARWVENVAPLAGIVDVEIVPQILFHNIDQLLKYEEEQLELGYEGVMLRAPHGPYKYGRSTVNEGYLLKLKRFEDSEATILGFEERMRNNNVATKNALGNTERSSHKGNKVGRGDLGSLVVRDVKTGVEFNIGNGDGLNDKLRDEIWKNRKKYAGKIVKYSFFPTGSKDKPRFPKFIGFRSPLDM